ncbi:MAG: 2-oxo acid dehydrogenase subunit E2 [Oscillospiraceae bacterium]|nr:2-oxo acid dehydrogenase subunit E2 [Oscillospiraceae bacterium]MBQ4545254.1 2-oxo acid dehydrogenase subunit E2 [Oscillospiraceae bacterium]MBQ6902024.1 2-oxo acid dehydrogenase subunit E2 [Oscillospiraceae bacterium]
MAENTKRKRRLGDRYDGYLVRNLDPVFGMIPYIMRTRLDSQIFFEEQIDISGLRKFIVENRESIPGLSMYHFFIAALVRTIVQRPRINRFISGRKIFSRSYIRISLTVKKDMHTDGEEGNLMPDFEPTDTLREVTEKFNAALAEVRAEEEAAKADGNGTDVLVKLLNFLPGFLKKFVVWTVRSLDSVGLMPKVINKFSPFHSSAYVTNVGSIGLNPVYHHLYEFGTTSVFMAIGKKEAINVPERDGTTTHKHVINMRFVLDERICDGYYFASAIKLFKYYVKNPELLLLPPDYISEDY